MKTIDEKLLSEYFSIKEDVENRAFEIACLVRDNDLRILVSFKGGIETLEITESDVSALFSESWSYGGYDSYTIAYNASYLTMSNEAILSDLEVTNVPIREKRLLAEKQRKSQERSQDLAKLKELTAKLKK